MNEIRKRKRIGIIGGSRPDKEALEAAFLVGELIGRAGAILVCGGLGGVMEAAARGASSAGGLTVGILPGRDAAEANPFIDIPIPTGMGYTRNALIALNADALIAIDGAYGTLSEIAFASIYGKKVVGLRTWDIRGIIRAATPEEAVIEALS